MTTSGDLSEIRPFRCGMTVRRQTDGRLRYESTRHPCPARAARGARAAVVGRHAVRSGADRGGVRACRPRRAAAGAGGRSALSVLRAGRAGRSRPGRIGPGTGGDRARTGARQLFRRLRFPALQPARAGERRRLCGDRHRHGMGRRALAAHSEARRRQHPGNARPRGSPAIDPRHRPRRHGGDRRARSHPVVQLGRRAAVRPLRRGGRRKERQDADAVALPRGARWLSRPLPANRRAPHHRHRPRRGRRTQGRLNLSDGACGRRDEIGQPAILHRLHPRPDRAAADRSAAAGAADPSWCTSRA